MVFTHAVLTARILTEQAGKQRYKGHADEGNTAARHKLLHALAFCTRIVVAVTLHEVDSPPNAKTCAKRDNEGLKNSYCAVEKCHIPCCRNHAGALLVLLFSPNCKSRNRLLQCFQRN